VIESKRLTSELEHLHAIREKQGDQFIDHLFNSCVAINIKIDQAAFVLRKKNGQVSYHGRHGRGDINKVKRASMDTYEPAIEHLEKRDLEQLPDNIEVFLELFSDKWQTTVQYKTKPVSNLIISYIKKDGEIIAPDEDINQDIAVILDVDPPPVLFKGWLSEYQKSELKTFAGASVDERKQGYGQSKFLEFVMRLFVTPEKLLWLQDGGYEGVVFYFKDAHRTAKMVDPMFTAEKQEEKKEEIGSFQKILYEVIHSHIKQDVDVVSNTFVESPDVSLSEDNFIKFISALTKYMSTQHINELSSLGDYEYEQKSKRFSNITLPMLPSYMSQLVDEHWWVEELYSTLSNLLIKEKRAINTKQGLTKERKEVINGIVKYLRDRNFGV
jgi:hypothetical protein